MVASPKLDEPSKLPKGEKGLKDKGYFLPNWEIGKVYSSLCLSSAPPLFERNGAVNREKWMSTILFLGKFHSFAL